MTSAHVLVPSKHPIFRRYRYAVGYCARVEALVVCPYHGWEWDADCLLTQTVLRTDSEADRPAADIRASTTR